MEGFGQSMEQTGKVLSFNTRVSNESLTQTIKQDPDDFISQMLDGYEQLEDFDTDLLDSDFDEDISDDELQDSAYEMSNEQENVLLGEELDLEQSLVRCKNLMDQLDQKLSRIHFYLGEIDRTGIC